MMIYCICDMRQAMFRLYYADTLTEAETAAVSMMNYMQIKWSRGEWGDSHFEYVERGHDSVANARVYIRIYPVDDYYHCHCGNVAFAMWRDGYLCDDHKPKPQEAG